MENSFSVLDVLETSWDITKKNIWVILGYSVIAIIALVMVQFASVFIMSIQNVFVNMIGLFTLLIVNSIATLGFYKLTFRLIDFEDEEVNFNNVIPTWKNISSFISLSLLLGLIVTTLTLIYAQLLKVPTFADFINIIKGNELYFGIAATIAFLLVLIISMRFMFFPCFIVDDDSSAFESIRQSRALTEDNLLKIITVFAIVIGFIALGFLALGIGIVITYPFTNVILVVTYRQLVNSYISEHPEEQEEESTS
jgi:uncharacterized membrane protein